MSTDMLLNQNFQDDNVQRSNGKKYYLPKVLSKIITSLSFYDQLIDSDI